MAFDRACTPITETDYKSQIKMPANEFQRICRDLQILGDTGA